MLDTRKIKILESIIKDYIQTAEPVGSRTVSKKYNLGISSATIRNEMADLEEMGYIIQPHASSGRIPSDKGYRFYVDNFVQKKTLSKEHIEYIKNAMESSIFQIDRLMQELASAISFLTNYTAIAAESKQNLNKIKHIQIAPIDKESILITLITESKSIKNNIVNIKNNLDVISASEISFILTKFLKSLSSDCIETKYKDIKKELINQKIGIEISEIILKNIKEMLCIEDKIQFFTSGVNNLLDFPEFADFKKAKGIINAIEEKDGISEIFANNSQEGNINKNIQIMIGNENNIQELKDCSIIKAKININDGIYYDIAIIGPTRMDYSRSLAALNAISKHIAGFG